VLGVAILPLLTILDLFRQCDIFWFSFYYVRGIGDHNNISIECFLFLWEHPPYDILNDNYCYFNIKAIIDDVFRFGLVYGA
jgi:hypothetical protein